MISNKKINELCELIAIKNKITFDDFYEIGLDTSDIMELVFEGKLTRKTNNTYTFHSYDDLYFNAKRLMKQEKYELSKNLFFKCLGFEKKSYELYYNAFKACVLSGDYVSCYKYLTTLKKEGKPHQNKMLGLYVYMLSFVDDIPEYYKPDIFKLEADDLFLNSDGRENTNEIIKLLFEQKFKEANSILDENYYNSILISLIDAAIKTNDEEIEKIGILVLNKNYIEINKFIREISEKHELDKKLISILSLTNDIIKIQNTGTIPIINEVISNDMYGAILSHDYIKAISLCDDNVILMLLNDIIKIITELQSNKISNFILKSEDLDKQKVF